MFVANGEGCIRLNLASPRSVLEEGLTRISRVLLEQNTAQNRRNRCMHTYSLGKFTTNYLYEM